MINRTLLKKTGLIDKLGKCKEKLNTYYIHGIIFSTSLSLQMSKVRKYVAKTQLSVLIQPVSKLNTEFHSFFLCSFLMADLFKLKFVEY